MSCDAPWARVPREENVQKIMGKNQCVFCHRGSERKTRFSDGLVVPSPRIFKVMLSSFDHNGGSACGEMCREVCREEGGCGEWGESGDNYYT